MSEHTTYNTLTNARTDNALSGCGRSYGIRNKRLRGKCANRISVPHVFDRQWRELLDHALSLGRGQEALHRTKTLLLNGVVKYVAHAHTIAGHALGFGQDPNVANAGMAPCSPGPGQQQPLPAHAAGAAPSCRQGGGSAVAFQKCNKNSRQLSFQKVGASATHRRGRPVLCVGCVGAWAAVSLSGECTAWSLQGIPIPL